MSKVRIIAANWKMHKTRAEAQEFIRHVKAPSSVKVFIAPSYTALEPSNTVTIGAQNMHESSDGAFTGEISARQIKDAGAKFVILGHSERRRLFHETDKLINLKMQKAFSSGLVPLLCIGETLDERKGGKTHATLSHQIKAALADLPPAEFVLAYEPVWAIGTGQTATPEMAEEAHVFCRELIQKLWSRDVPILYGGSVTPETAPALAKQKNIDGALVGGASLDVNKFNQIIEGFTP
jgi:triosephosphate isomerase